MIVNRKSSVRTRANKTDVRLEDKQSEATVYLYGDIGGYFGIDSEEFVKNINEIDAKTIHVRIDSAGGDIFSARAMKTAIMQHKAKVIAHIDGLAASAASFFAMGADEIEIVDGGFLMIHMASSFMDILGYFNIDDLKDLETDIGKEIKLHGKINESIANDYAKRTGHSADKILAWMSEETWFSAKDAIDNKFVDRVYDGAPVEGSYDLSIYGKVPEEVKCRNQKATKRAIEKALRDVGLSNKQAKKAMAFLSDGKDDHDLTEGLRDEELPVGDPPAAEIQRDAELGKKDRVSELLCRAEIVAPSTN